MNRNDIRTARISLHEARMDSILRTVSREGITPDVYARVLPDLKKLEAYYTGPDWKEDYAADECGLLPPELKRGVLSQDGIHDLLDSFREYRVSEEPPEKPCPEQEQP